VKAFRIAAVIFHLEGTLLNSPLRAVKAAAGCPVAIELPDFLRALSGPDRRRRISTLERIEQEAPASAWTPQPGARRLIDFTRGQRLGLGIISHHGREAARQRLESALRLRSAAVDDLCAREELLAAGRRANPLRAACRRLRQPPAKVLLISADPAMIATAHAAGCLTIHRTRGSAAPPLASPADFCTADPHRIQRILRLGLPLPAGKLPNDLLCDLLGEVVVEDPSLIINPGVGEDIAAVDVDPEEVLVLKSDPITFATKAIGHYAVLVNANDIATAGATPRWLLTTLLFPPGSTASAVWSVVGELQQNCRAWGITLCGGHTEITPAVRRPVVCGMMAGTVRRRDLIDKRRMHPGDQVLLTKSVAVEGTAIIAREFGPKLAALGLTAAEINVSRALLDQISIIPEARIAAATAGTSAMHDVTEGGLATALEELSTAGGFGIRVRLEKIPVFPETRNICRLLRIHPLGLIGSGSLLIICRPNSCRRLETALERACIPVARIGEVVNQEPGIEATRKGRAARWPAFEVDEMARLFERETGH
jgi:hydrogenase maturation factor/beta-phosphoglucomutase-like phosphatase (HAD superfamily)